MDLAIRATSHNFRHRYGFRSTNASNGARTKIESNVRRPQRYHLYLGCDLVAIHGPRESERVPDPCSHNPKLEQLPTTLQTKPLKPTQPTNFPLSIMMYFKATVLAAALMAISANAALIEDSDAASRTRQLKKAKKATPAPTKKPKKGKGGGPVATTEEPSDAPSMAPSMAPSAAPSKAPTGTPTGGPTPGATTAESSDASDSSTTSSSSASS
eukprot:jgi/Psemu1/44239/gm1.44239_g